MCGTVFADTNCCRGIDDVAVSCTAGVSNRSSAGACERNATVSDHRAAAHIAWPVYMWLVGRMYQLAHLP